ncbi:MAG TPA: hypothetical protein VMW76_04080 [Bacteroidales bacterium]|nr:hypothetical protein [Bacteroidales bacterium]
MVFTLLTVWIGSCNKEEYDVIPDVAVDFYIDLDDPLFASLGAIGNSVLIDANTNNLGMYAAGFDGNGIILYRAQLDEFFAYDRTCPHDYALNQSSIRVNVDGIYAICPECETNYALPGFGTPVSGPSKYPLKVYKASFNGQYVHVYNQ